MKWAHFSFDQEPLLFRRSTRYTKQVSTQIMKGYARKLIIIYTGAAGNHWQPGSTLQAKYALSYSGNSLITLCTHSIVQAEFVITEQTPMFRIKSAHSQS